MKREEAEKLKKEIWDWIRSHPNRPEAQMARQVLGQMEPLLIQLERHTEPR